MAQTVAEYLFPTHLTVKECRERVLAVGQVLGGLLPAFDILPHPEPLGVFSEHFRRKHGQRSNELWLLGGQRSSTVAGPNGPAIYKDEAAALLCDRDGLLIAREFVGHPNLGAVGILTTLRSENMGAADDDFIADRNPTLSDRLLRTVAIAESVASFVEHAGLGQEMVARVPFL